MQYWELDGNERTCRRHRTRFSLTGTCPACDADPPPKIEIETRWSPPEPPKGCVSTVQLERELLADAAEMKRLRNKLSGKTRPRSPAKPANVLFDAEPAPAPEPVVLDTHAYNSIAKLQDARTKALRVVAELAIAREHEELVFQLKQLKRQKGGRH